MYTSVKTFFLGKRSSSMIYKQKGLGNYCFFIIRCLWVCFEEIIQSALLHIIACKILA